jgi:hypothetical protein
MQLNVASGLQAVESGIRRELEQQLTMNQLNLEACALDPAQNP